MFDSLKKMFSGKSLDALKERVAEISALEPEIQKLNNDELTAESLKLKERVASEGELADDAVTRACALAREAARRTLGQRPFDVQLMGGLVIHQGAVAEMMTGE